MPEEPGTDGIGGGSEQDKLFIGEERGGVKSLDELVIPGELLDDQVEVLSEIEPIERSFHLLNCLNALAAVNMRVGLQKAGIHALGLESYGGHRGNVVAGAGRNAKRILTEAKQHFARACDLDGLLADDPDHEPEIKRGVRRAFERFTTQYGVDHIQLDKARRQLRRHIKTGVETKEIDVITTITKLNREQNFRPYQEDISDELETTDEDSKKLKYRNRLEVLRFDPRAGFLPTTRAELNTVVAYLDYLDNPDYPLGVTDQLFEVVSHQQKIDGFAAAEGHRAAESITWEIGDHAIDAALATTSLKQLAQDIEVTNPELKLVDVDEVGANNPALAYVFQYFDLLEFIREGKVAGLNRDPARTRPQRYLDQDGREVQGMVPGKHKRIYSPYTRPDRTKDFEKHYLRQLNSLTIRDLRLTLPDIIANHERRLEFMLARLGETDQFFGEKPGHLTDGVKKAVADSEAIAYAVFTESDQRPEAA